MSISSVFAILAVALALAAILYVWRRLATEGSGSSDGTPGSVLDASESVRRVDLGQNAYVAQQAQGELSEDGLKTRVVTLESGAFGIGMGEQYYIVYNAEDEARVLAVVDRLLAEFETPDGSS
jgi:hypothetical protein